MVNDVLSLAEIHEVDGSGTRGLRGAEVYLVCNGRKINGFGSQMMRVPRIEDEMMDTHTKAPSAVHEALKFEALASRAPRRRKGEEEPRTSMSQDSDVFVHALPLAANASYRIR